MENSIIAHLNGVEGNTTADDRESNQFNLATPIGRLQIWVDDPNAKSFFKKGSEYYLDISEVK